MRREIIAIAGAAAVALSMGVAPVAAEDSGTPATPTPGPAPVAAAADWTEPAATVEQDPASLVEASGDSGTMTVVYAVQDGDDLQVRTVPAASQSAAERTIAAVQDRPDVLAVDVDAPRRLTGLPAVTPATDPARTEQWGLDTLRAETAWDSSTGSGVTIAILDSGVARHPDLAGAFVPGTDIVNGGDGRQDLNGHGTHVAGIIAMTANNGRGGAGLAPGASLMPVRVADDSGWVRSSDSARGIIWAVDRGADVLNMSYSGSASSVEQKAIQYAVSKGVVPVAAVGNAYVDDGGSLYNPIQYPAAFPGVLGVGAITRSQQRSSFSEVGKQVDVVAPGGSGLFDSARGIYSTYVDGRYVRMPGTSMATPFTAAALALVISRERALGLDISPSDVLLGTAADLGGSGRDDEFGFGLINPVAALDLLSAIATSGARAPVMRPSEVQTRIVHRLRVQTRPGLVRFRIPATGRFIVGMQRLKPTNHWTKPTTLKGSRLGRTWYSVALPAGLQIRVVAVREDSPGKGAPVWVSPTKRTRTAAR